MAMPAVAAEEGNNGRVKLMVFFFIQSFFTTGLVFGWPALEQVLRADGVFSGAATDAERDGRFANVFNVSQALLTFMMLPAGMLLDRFGPRATSCFGSLLAGIGSALFAFSSEDYLVYSFSLMCIGGAPVHLAWMHSQVRFKLRSCCCCRCCTC